MSFTKQFSELSKKDVSLAGGKGASLGEMTSAGLPVPPGFVVLSSAFETFLNENNLHTEIDTVLHSVNKEAMHTIENASEQIQALILGGNIPLEIKQEIEKEFSKLNAEFVAVRSSATAEDSASAAWAGQLDTFLNTTKTDLLSNIKKCWASLFTPRAIFYRFEQQLHEDHISVAVVVQKMIASEISGIAFSVHPVTQDYNQLIIEAGFGLGEAIVSGSVTPDSYVVEKGKLDIIEKHIGEQSKQLVRKQLAVGSKQHEVDSEQFEVNSNEWQELGKKGKEQKLSEKQIIELSKIIINIENHYGFPVDVEWALEKDKFFITQSRPITTLQGTKVATIVLKDGDLVEVDANEGIVRVLKKNQLHFINTYTRDFSIVMEEVFQYALSEGLKKKIGFENPHHTSIFHIIDGIIQVWESTEAYNAMQNFFLEKNKDSSLMKQTVKEYTAKLNKLKPVLEKGKLNSLEDLKQFIKDLYEITTLFCLFYYPGLNEKTPKEILEISHNIRNEDTFFDDADNVIRNTLLNLYPHLKGCESTLLTQEILKEKHPSKDILLERKKNFVYVTPTEQYIMPLEEYASKNTQYQFAIEKANPATTEIKGQTGHPGKVTGTVKIMKRKEQIPDMIDGAILVSQMTTPAFLPAMKKASALVTDEGGITCHAAIVARELKKPCVIGTKVATQILKDGDLVEVDANTGTITILSKNKTAAITLSPIYTRDMSLLYFYLWNESDRIGYKKYLDYDVKHNLFMMPAKERKTTVYYNEKELEEIDKLLIEKSKNKQFQKQLLDDIEKNWKLLEPYAHGKQIENITEFKTYYTTLVNFWAALNTPYTIAKLDLDVNQQFKNDLLAFREKTEKHTATLSDLLHTFLKTKYPALGEHVKLVAPEDLDRLADNKTLKEIKTRETGYALYNNKIYSIVEINKILEKENIQIEKPETNITELKGTCAWKGQVKGKVRLVVTDSEADNLQKGEILVTEMTSPRYLAAMQKAGGIITDEGGITCHAAITARELKLPCVIGTKQATQVLKTGDYVEIDAEKGLVRIIKN